MSDHTNGGQAFPTHPVLYGSADQHLAQGMSLRDWFAGQALPYFLSSTHTLAVASALGMTGSQGAAAAAYEIADAMLAARKGAAQ